MNSQFWKNKKVFLTGHTGFKGSWTAVWLQQLGAQVYGYSLSPETKPSLFEATGIGAKITQSWIADIRDFQNLQKCLIEAQPDIVLHMAAQPLVRLSYENPIETYETNVMGTMHLMQALRFVPSVKATVIVTSDKCYENLEVDRGYTEEDAMGGYDPYSSSKGCTEIVAASMRRSFFNPKEASTKNFIATVRAGNVIGGGDWSADRLIPDSVKNWSENKAVVIRNPKSVRPWQHVLEPIKGYFEIAEKLFTEGASWAQAWNFGPESSDQKNVEFVLERMIHHWGPGAQWVQDTAFQPHEAKLLMLNISKVQKKLGWKPTWTIEQTIQETCSWYKGFYAQPNKALDLCLNQIQKFMNQSEISRQKETTL